MNTFHHKAPSWKIMRITEMLLFFLIAKTRTKLLLTSVVKSSMNQCIESLIHKYAHENETILVSSTGGNGFSNVQLQNLQVNFNWTFLIEKLREGKTLIYHYFRYTKKPSFFLLYLKNGEDPRIKLRIQRQLSPIAKFVIIPKASHTKTYTDIAKEIVKVLWEENIINGLVLVPDPENDDVFNVYTWKYQQSNCLHSKKDIKLITKCSFGIFTDNITLFSNKAQTLDKSCSVFVGVVEFAPFAMNMKNNSLGLKDDYFTKEGIEINLLNLVANDLKINVFYRVFPDINWGHAHINGTASGNLLYLTESKIDIALGDYELTWARAFSYDASYSYMRDSLIWCVPHEHISHQIMYLVFDRTSSILISIVYLVVTILIWYSSSRTKRSNSYSRIISVIQATFSILIGAPISKTPRTIKLRILMFTLLLLSFTVISLYQTFLTSMLAKSNFVEKYDAVEDIYEYDLKTYFPRNADRYFNERYEKNDVLFKKWINCENFKMCMDFVAFRRDSAFCVYEWYKKYVFNYYITDDDIHCFGRLVNFPLVMLMRKGFPLHGLINRSISRITAAGLLVKWERDILRAKTKVRGPRLHRKHDGANYLKLKNLTPIFHVLLIGQGVGGIIFVLELVYCKMQIVI